MAWAKVWLRYACPMCGSSTVQRSRGRARECCLAAVLREELRWEVYVRKAAEVWRFSLQELLMSALRGFNEITLRSRPSECLMKYDGDRFWEGGGLALEHVWLLNAMCRQREEVV